MSRVWGFIAGVTTSSTLLYLFTLEIGSNTREASFILRQSSDSIEASLQPKQYKIVKPVEIKTQSNLVETMKDLWDEEVVMGASWVLAVDTDKWCRDTASNIWNKLFKSSRS